MREEFIEFLKSGSVSMSELCRRFGISRKTGYKWKRRYGECGRAGGGAGGVEWSGDRSRRPRGCPHRSSAEMEAEVLAARAEHPAWGGRKLKHLLESRGYRGVPAASTITSILRRGGLLESHGSGPVRAGSYQRFEREAPNELWQMDFKGEFRTQRAGYCYPLGMLDDHSRYNLMLEARGDQRTHGVRASLGEAFRRYGLPRQLLCDNGPPWGTSAEGGSGYTELGVWLLGLGVDIIHGRAYHPQTQGKQERFHRSLKAEVLSRPAPWEDLREVGEAFQQWRRVYNHQRGHEALQMRPPGEVYAPSPRRAREGLLEGALPEMPYHEADTVRTVNALGRVMYKNRTYMIGRAFQKKP
ncbi:MAG: IS481 family transposase, partial [Verrucomicrobiota bacterium]